jgi:hypothetical protein
MRLRRNNTTVHDDHFIKYSFEYFIDFLEYLISITRTPIACAASISPRRTCDSQLCYWRAILAFHYTI